ncbi:hypothetical protein KJ359_006939 [Pestalotiopsis sp. 9143b]|nr:hypothetical protein KJ359_006939 [Pestalotiopsis sp. 9143b]
MSSTTKIILPGGCSFHVAGPSDLTRPYFPVGPDINHGYSCQCQDEQGVMDDDVSFMALWLQKWAEWNISRVLTQEMHNDPQSRSQAYNAFCRRHLDWATAYWGLPSIGNSFVPSGRTAQPIEWFWRCLAGERDLSHCSQPDHATRFFIYGHNPFNPSWEYNHLTSDSGTCHTATPPPTFTASRSRPPSNHRPSVASSYYSDYYSSSEADNGVSKKSKSSKKPPTVSSVSSCRDSDEEGRRSMARTKERLDAEYERIKWRRYGL